MELDKQASKSEALVQFNNEEDINRLKEVSELKLLKENQIFEQSKKQWVNLNKIYKTKYTLTDLPDLLNAMRSGSEKKYLMVAQGFRKILAVEHHWPIQQIIDAGVLSFLIDWIQKFDYPQLQYESARTIINIASGTKQNCQVIVDKGAVPFLIELMNSTNEEVKTLTVWATGTIGGNFAYFRDSILQNQGLPLLINCLKHSQNHTQIKNSSWAISRLCQCKPLPNFKMLIDAMPVLAELIKTQHDAKILKYSLSALSLLCGNEEQIEYLIHTGVVHQVLQLLNHHSLKIRLFAISIVFNILTGNEQHIQLVIDLGGVQALSALVDSYEIRMQSRAVLSISKICAGSKAQLDRLITAGVIPKLVARVYSYDQDIKKKSVCALRNAAAGGSPFQVVTFVQSGIIQALCSLFQEKDLKIILAAMNGLSRILKCGKEHFSVNKEISEFASIVEQCDGLVKLKELQNHSYYFIALKASSMIVTYF